MTTQSPGTVAEQPKEERLIVLLTPEQKIALRVKAARMGKNMSDYVRDTLLSDTVAQAA